MTYVIYKPCENNIKSHFTTNNLYSKFTMHFNEQHTLAIRVKVGVPMTVTTCNQQENVIFIPHKQIKNHTRYIKRAIKKLETICSNCNNCKQAILLPDSVYCGKLRELVANISNCPHFDLEPLEYRLYKRI